MTVSRDNSLANYTGTRASGVRCLTSQPETWLLYLLQLAEHDPEMSLVEVAKEDGPYSRCVRYECSRRLADERDVLGVEVETAGTDAGQAGRFEPQFPNHTIMHGAGKFGLTSLHNLDQLPATGAILIAAP